jgi:hypothetical protein
MFVAKNTFNVFFIKIKKGTGAKLPGELIDDNIY